MPLGKTFFSTALRHGHRPLRRHVDGDQPQWTRALSLAALTVLELSPPEQVHCAADAGYSQVGLRLVPATAQEPQRRNGPATPALHADASRARRARHASARVEIVRLHPDTDVAGLEPVLESGLRARRGCTCSSRDTMPTKRAWRTATPHCASARGRSASRRASSPCHGSRYATCGRPHASSSARAPTNAGVLVDAIHFDRAGDTPADLANHRTAAPALPAAVRRARRAAAPATRWCDRPAPRGCRRAMAGWTCAGCCKPCPPTSPVSLEVPYEGGTALERARRVLEATRRLLAEQKDAAG
jgi:hypothetical protein